MARKYGWSKNVLIHQIENQTYEKSMLGQTNFDRELTPELRAQAKLAIKDEYNFDFLEMGELAGRLDEGFRNAHPDVSMVQAFNFTDPCVK
jgi:predicted nuclease of restriction endonuclease-like (RecB) superfamily